MKSSLASLKALFSEGHERSIRAKKNIIASFGIRAASVLVGFLMVPMTIHYVNATKYGIWVTLSSFVSWFGFFDIGLGNGLRNRFAEALAKGDKILARTYVSTAYTTLTVVVLIIAIIFLVVSPFLRWAAIFNTPPELEAELGKLVFLVFVFFIVQLVVQLVSTVITADQKPALSSFVQLLGNILAIAVVFFLTKTTTGSLVYLGVALSASPLAVMIVASLYFYSTRYREYAPAFRYVDMRHAKDLTNIGFQFFVIQLASLLLFASSNMIIAQLFGPLEVTPYNIAFRYFGVVTMVFGIIATPFWSAYTEAYHKGDIAWIKSATRKLIMVWAILGLGTGAMLLVSSYVYRVWIGGEILVPFTLSSVMALFVILSTWNNIFAFFLNGTGKIRLQLYSAIAVGVINIPLSIFFAKVLGIGIAGVVLATCCCVAVGSIWAPIQYYKIVHNTAKGIWAR